VRFIFRHTMFSFRHVTFNFTRVTFNCTHVRFHNSFHCFATCSTFCLIPFTCFSLGVDTRIFRLPCGDVASRGSSVGVETHCRL
jgi:hypothetical protein